MIGKGVVSSSKKGILDLPYALFGGNFKTYKNYQGGIIKIKSNGDKDETFDVGYGLSKRNISSDGSMTIGNSIILSNGKVITVGTFTKYDDWLSGPAANRIARINTDGTLDTGFNVGTGFNSTPKVIKEGPDGKYYVGGVFTSYNGTSSSRLIRLNTDGTVDNTFNIGTGFNSWVYAIDFQSDGKIIVGGYFTTVNSISQAYVCRLNTDGSLDATFSSGLNTYVNDIAVDSNDNVYLGGGFGAKLVKKLSDGTTTTFPTASAVVSSCFVDDANDHLYVGTSGRVTGANGYGLNRIFLSTGLLDTTFDASIGSGFDATTNVVLDSNNNIYVSGSFTTFNGASNVGIIKLTNGGVKDISFDNTNSSIVGASISIDSNDDIILTNGQLLFYKKRDGYIVSVNSDSTNNESFNVDKRGFNDNGYVYAVGLDEKSSNKYTKNYVSGNFTSYNGIDVTRICRLNGDGSIDNTFNTGTGLDSTASCVMYDTNLNKVIFGGNFTSYNGTSVNRIIRINNDGSIDNTFNIGTGFSSTVKSIVMDSNGKYYVGGYFTSYNGTSVNRIIRINNDGSIDNTFNIGTGLNGVVLDMQKYNDDRLLLGGTFTDYNGSVVTRVCRLNSDGSLDTGFVNTINNTVYSVSIYKSDGKIICSGGFSSPRSRICRINDDGSYDSSYQPPTPFTSGAFCRLDEEERTVCLVTSRYNGVIRHNKSNGSYDSTFPTQYMGGGFGGVGYGAAGNANVFITREKR